MSSDVCPCCEGEGGWTDWVARKSVVCPCCHPDLYSSQREESPRLWLDSLGQHPCKHPGPRFSIKPWLLVIHSGAGDGDIARFFSRVGFYKRGGTGKKVLVSAHINWDARADTYTQGLPLDTVGWHCGGSRIYRERLFGQWPDAEQIPQGQDLRKLNFCSIGIELRGPAGRRHNKREHRLIQGIVRELMEAHPTLRVATKHQWIDARKRDPGSGFRMEALEELGLVTYR